MKKVTALSILLGLAILGLSTGTASAWYYRITGSGACQPDGSYKITWKVDNTSEPTTLEIHSSSNTAVVPVGTRVPARKFSNFTQNADGTKPGTFTLTLRGDWHEDRNNQRQSATVRLSEACEQPVAPEEPGRGGEVLSEQVTVTPVGAVNAGEGKVTANVAAVAGVVASATMLVYGIVRSLKARA